MSDAQAPTPPPESEHLAELRTQLRAVKTAMAQALKSESPETVLRAAAASTELLDQIKAEEAKASEARDTAAKASEPKPPKGHKARSTRLTTEQRMEAVFELMIEGESTAGIVRFASREGWNVTRRQIQDYMAQATERFRQAADFDRPAQIGKALRRYQKLHMTASRAGDTRAAADAQGRLCKLLGLDAPTMARVLTINTDPAALEAMSDDALADLIQKIG